MERQMLSDWGRKWCVKLSVVVFAGRWNANCASVSLYCVARSWCSYVPDLPTCVPEKSALLRWPICWTNHCTLQCRSGSIRDVHCPRLLVGSSKGWGQGGHLQLCEADEDQPCQHGANIGGYIMGKKVPSKIKEEFQYLVLFSILFHPSCLSVAIFNLLKICICSSISYLTFLACPFNSAFSYTPSSI